MHFVSLNHLRSSRIFFLLIIRPYTSQSPFLGWPEHSGIAYRASECCQTCPYYGIWRSGPSTCIHIWWSYYCIIPIDLADSKLLSSWSGFEAEISEDIQTSEIRKAYVRVDPTGPRRAYYRTSERHPSALGPKESSVGAIMGELGEWLWIAEPWELQVYWTWRPEAWQAEESLKFAWS